MLVEAGDTVKKGQPLFEIKNNPGVKFTAPRAGTVTAVNRGERRAFQSLVIKVDDKAGKVSFKKHTAASLESITREEAQDELMESGPVLPRRGCPWPPRRLSVRPRGWRPA